MTRDFSATGWSGGLLNWSADTEQELQAGISAAVQRAGGSVASLTMSVDEYDVLARVFSNEFHYTVTARVNVPNGVSDPRLWFANLLSAVAGNPAIVSDLSSGQSAQTDVGAAGNNSNPFPGIADALAKALIPIAVVAIVALVLVER